MTLTVGIEPTTPRLEVWCATIAPREHSSNVIEQFFASWSVKVGRSQLICPFNVRKRNQTTTNLLNGVKFFLLSQRPRPRNLWNTKGFCAEKYTTYILSTYNTLTLAKKDPTASERSFWVILAPARVHLLSLLTRLLLRAKLRHSAQAGHSSMANHSKISTK